jgi:hypothetical protein
MVPPPRSFRFLGFLALSACGFLIPSPRHTPRERALEAKASYCDESARAAGAHLAGPTVIAEVAPITIVAHGNRSGDEAKLQGARLTIRAEPGLTVAWLERALRCHAALEVLGEVPAAPSDPYVLPGGWVEIRARTGDSGLEVDLLGDDVDDSLRILARAQAFVRPTT